MGKKTASSLGNAVIRDRRKLHGRGGSGDANSMRHVADLNDGYDWAKLNLNSVTEQNNLEEFLATAELAGTEFQAEKLNITFINPKSSQGLLSIEEKRVISDLHDQHRDVLRVPRRPPWDKSMSPEDLQRLEQETFLDWRKQLNELESVEGILLTPFEKNLEFWRQLWRVIERSDVVVQIVDARDPLLFWCEDLEKYVGEVSQDKMNLILINKADFLNAKQRKSWADYFQSKGVKVVFFSALQELDSISNQTTKSDGTSDSVMIDSLESSESGKIYSRMELIDYFKTVHQGQRVNPLYTTIGLVGYPNVGKSSTINTLLNAKKTSVSVTPGKTKHFQTLFVEDELCLCDCPGLVMPMFVSTKADMVVSGILPIDQMRDHIGPVNLIASRFPRYVLEEKYGIILPKPMEEEDQTRPPHAEELLNSYSFMRGFMTQRGLPDVARGARYIVKDYVCGKLLYCNGPPVIEDCTFHQFPPPTSTINKVSSTNSKEVKVCQLTTGSGSSKEVDETFFKKASTGVHFKNSVGEQINTLREVEKPWKKHHNRKKKEKLRRVYAD